MMLNQFEVLTFDCYGTLIDSETGLWNALQPLLSAGGLAITRKEALVLFGELVRLGAARAVQEGYRRRDRCV